MASPKQSWSVDKSFDLYNIGGWGAPYVSIDPEGFLRVQPEGPEGPNERLDEIVEMARRQGMSLPLLVRFDGILGHRVRSLANAFAQASKEIGYGGRYRPVYPIKVNQQRHVVEELIDAGSSVGLGLEVGSKPELMAVVALLDRPSLVICNGYKDETYIQMATLAVRLGHEVVVVIEKPSEIETIHRVVKQQGKGAAPFLGLRARLASKGTGRWAKSTGDRAKFGLSPQQLVDGVDWLRDVGLLERVRLLHFHLGSQITAIRPWKAALREAGRLFVELRQLGCPLDLFDVGGGLAVDYDGSRTNFSSSMNYTEQEYANDVVWHIHDACEKADMPSPDIVTESGRALVAHHSMMVVEVTGAARLSLDGHVEDAGDDEHEIVTLFRENLANLSAKTVLEVFHDAMSLRDEMLTRFGLGLVDLRTRALCENLYFATCDRVAKVARAMDAVPEDLAHLEESLADTYFCNFSVFQSVPDSWAIGQIFPVVPIRRLNEEPTRRAVLGDLTCDSDGKIDRFPDLRDVKPALEVHRLREGESYRLAIFFVGAYQEILGDLHNLFGDTDTVHVDFDGKGKAFLVDRVRGEPVAKVLSWVGYGEAWLLDRYDRALERLVRGGQLSGEDAGKVRRDLLDGLQSHTYLTAREVAAVREDDLVESEDDGSNGDANGNGSDGDAASGNGTHGATSDGARVGSDGASPGSKKVAAS
ncbi:MAG: biosynthetic arginine decarboxylase [Planctomycetes bacterium]|nr:biosynthetic arginine decarboxylase [Planctomycetota bacterium]